MRETASITPSGVLGTRWRTTEFQRQITRTLVLTAALLLTLVGSFVIGKTDYGFLVVGGVLAAMCALLIALRPEYGLYILLLFIYANVSAILEDNYGLPDANRYLVALIFVGTFAGRLVMERKPLVFRTVEMTILAFAIVGLLTLLVGNAEVNLITVATDVVKDLAILFIMVQLCTSEMIFKRAVWVIILTATFLGTISIFQSVTDNYANTFYGLATSPISDIAGGEQAARVSGPIGDPNFYGMILAAALPSALYRLFDARVFSARLLAGFCSAVILLTVFFTFSRGAFVTLVVLGVFIIRDRRMNPYKIAAGLLAVFLLTLPVLPSSFWDRVSSLAGILPGASQESAVQADDSFRGRMSEYIVGMQMFYDYPLLGVGAGSYEENYLDYSAKVGLDGRFEARQAHSLYIEIAAEQGVIGVFTFLIMLLFIFNSLRIALRNAQAIGRKDLISWVTGVRLGLIGYLASSIFLHGDFFRYFWLYVGFAAASSVMVQEQVEQIRQKRKLDQTFKSLPNKSSAAPTSA